MSFVVRVPASSANLGPGFDALGMALTLYATIGLHDGDEPLVGRAAVVDDRHPALVAFRRAGGTGPLWMHCPIPSGRGLGFSGAVRVGGVLAAFAQRRRDDAGASTVVADDGEEVLAIASELEGHADNAAASLLGGVVAVAGGRAVRVPLGLDPAIVVWVPSHSTSTDDSRSRLPTTLPMADAVFNLGRTALLVAALAAGDVAALGSAVQDRLHQDVRLARAPSSGRALVLAREHGAWASWLSGSGPTIAAMCAHPEAAGIAAALDQELHAAGHTKILAIDRFGATVHPRPCP